MGMDNEKKSPIMGGDDKEKIRYFCSVFILN